MYAFTDESGNHEFNFDQDGVSTYFIVTAVLITEARLNAVENEVEAIRKKYFQTEEMKSSLVGKNHARRLEILNELMDTDFKIFSVVVDKQKLFNDSGLMYQESFYKFVNNLVHKELRYAFKKLVVCADEIGGNEYMKSFCNYVKDNEDIPNLFGEREFYFQDSKNNVLIQLAGFISGTLSFEYEKDKKEDAPNYIKILDKKIIRIEHFPRIISKYIIEKSTISDEHNNEISDICLRHIQGFLSKYEKAADEDRMNQVIVLKYLCSKFLNNDTRKYIPTTELINNLKYRTGKAVSMQYFRTRIIAKLRDEGVIIASSSKGYKIPAKENELYDFINHGTTIIMPMLARLKKCRDNIKIGTGGNLDLFDNSEYTTLRQFFDI
ncbi:DUF3800 domain-containing protein [Lachnoclostridium sp.]|nr:DUF3800 domain-containing protein [Lachnoclostridium sp.]